MYERPVGSIESLEESAVWETCRVVSDVESNALGIDIFKICFQHKGYVIRIAHAAEVVSSLAAGILVRIFQSGAKPFTITIYVIVLQKCECVQAFHKSFPVLHDIQKVVPRSDVRVLNRQLCGGKMEGRISNDVRFQNSGATMPFSNRKALCKKTEISTGCLVLQHIDGISKADHSIAVGKDIARGDVVLFAEIPIVACIENIHAGVGFGGPYIFQNDSETDVLE